jgi:hypothetical protein
VTLVGGVPEMVGGSLDEEPLTLIENGASAAPAKRLWTLMTICANVPMFALLGVPLSLPVVALKLAQDGLFEMEKRTYLSAQPDTVGVKL